MYRVHRRLDRSLRKYGGAGHLDSRHLDARHLDSRHLDSRSREL
jgi:hypothetical protein